MSDLIIPENIKPLDIFGKEGGLDPIITKIKKEVESEVFDVSTKQGRERMNSVSRKVGGTVTRLEKMALKLTQDWRNQTNKVNAEKKRMKEELYAVRDILKIPLDNFKAQEAQRKESHNINIETLRGFKDINTNQSSVYLRDELSKLNEFYNSINDWQEFKDNAEGVYHISLSFLNGVISTQERLERQAAEIEQARIEKKEREQKEREELIAKEAAQEAKLKAEKAAQEEKQKLIDAELKAKEDARLEKERAEKQAKEAEQKRISELNRVKLEKEALEKKRINDLHKAQLEKEAALKEQREKAEKIKQKEQDEIAKRNANIEHKKLINNNALQDLMAHTNLERDIAITVLKVIVSNKISNVTINY